MTVSGLQLGPPGVYVTQLPRTPRLRPVRLDVAGFAGVAGRGPVDTPVAVESWSEFRWVFGGSDGPGLLGPAVRAFFAQGGRRAVVCRVSPLPRGPDPQALAARARHRVSFGTTGAGEGVTTRWQDVVARDEGSWGDALTVEVDFVAAARLRAPVLADVLTVPSGSGPAVGSLLRLRGPGFPVAGGFRTVTTVEDRVDGAGRRQRVALLDRAVPGPTAVAVDLDVDIVTATVRVADADPGFAREDVLTDLGLTAAHPRWLVDVVRAESRLVCPDGDWPDVLVPPDALLGTVRSSLTDAGTDRWSALGRDSLFGDTPVELLPTDVADVDADNPVFGVDLLALVPEIALLCVPDLFWSHAEDVGPTTFEPPPPRQPTFGPCQPLPVALSASTVGVVGGRLDARTELDEVFSRQQRLVALAEQGRRAVALLDVPERLSVDAIARWRARLDSSFAAAYHPWLAVAADRDGDPAVPVPPSAFAAGIVADRERRLGIPWGPANALAVGAVLSAVRLSDPEHAALHALDVDVFRDERDGFRLTSAHTLSSDPAYRQLSVRRLMTMLRLVLERECQWLAFEPNTARLRRQVARSVTQLLRDLYRGGAFAGRTEEESFFVRCDDTVNPRTSIELGRLVAEVGVAPSTPLEFIVVRLAQDAEGLVQVEG